MPSNKNLFLQELQEGVEKFSALGYIVYWNITNVFISKTNLEAAMEQAGLSKSYIKEHNVLSTLVRALHSMEEDRIIRMVENTKEFLVYQFTAEKLVQEAGEKSLEYNKETLVVINRTIYRDTGDFKAAITKCDEKIKNIIVDLFQKHKSSYKSSDLTRFLQKILVSEADIISLRPQGSIYFVPAGYKPIIDKLQTVINCVGGGSTLDCIPIPALSGTKALVKNALNAEIDGEFKKLEKEIEKALTSDKDISDVWSKTRIGRTKDMLDRIAKYADGGILTKDEQNNWCLTAQELEKKVAGVRKLEIE